MEHDNEPVTVYFGDRWDAPILDGRIHQVATPVGDQCLFCGEPIEAGDRGLMRNAIRERDGQPVASIEPAHMECDRRMMVGNVAHLEGRCNCNDPTRPMEGSVLSFREEAREVVAYFNQQRARSGRKPL
jgi:hypothetical protein